MDISTEIMKLIEQEFDIPMKEMHPNSALMDDLDLSSFELMTLIGALEEKFHITIPEAKYQNIITIGDLAKVIAA